MREAESGGYRPAVFAGLGEVLGGGRLAAAAAIDWAHVAGLTPAGVA